MAFSVSAFAVDVKVSAEYYAAGMYLNKTSVNSGYEGNSYDNPSTAFFFQRLRVGTDFVVSPSLKLVTRFDAMERIWGGTRSNPGTYDGTSAATRAESENIAFDLAYINYVSPIGLFEVGYQPDYVWGTVFGNRSNGPTAGIITYGVPIGPVTIVAQYAKEADLSASAVTSSSVTDNDYDSYRLGAIYNFKGGEAGALLLYNRIAESKANTYGPYDMGYLTTAYKVIPYFKTKIGPVALQGEFEYTFGDAVKAESPSLLAIGGQQNVSISAWSAFLDATADFGMFNVGGTFVYLSGDDTNTSDKVEGGVFHGIGVNTSGLDWSPCLILFNTETAEYWAGSITGHTNSVVNAEMSNAWFFQGRVGVKPTPKWDVQLALSYATADKKPQNPLNPGVGHSTYANGTYGTEIDVTGTYKITNNLSYMLGVGYLFTGDYFKGFDRGGDYTIDNDYMLINKLTLNF